MKITILISVFAAALLASVQQPTHGCKIRDSPHVVRGVLECILAKFLRVIPAERGAQSQGQSSAGWTAPRGLDNSPMQVNMLMHSFSRHLDLVDQIVEAADEAAQKDAASEMQALLKDASLQRGLAAFFQDFSQQSLQMENWLNQLVEVLGPEEAADMLVFAEQYGDIINTVFAEEYDDITTYSNISNFCATIANFTGWDFCATAKCLRKYDETDFEDGLRWGECLYTCQDLPDISTCVYDVIHADCSRKPKLAPMIVRGFMAFFGFETTCLYSVKFNSERPPQDAVELYEGGPPVMVELKSYVPATVYCAQFGNLAEVVSTVGYRVKQFFLRGGDCHVQFQMSLSNYLTGIVPIINLPQPVCTSVQLANPKCRDNSLLTQALIGNHTHQSGASCLINITDDNWQLTHHFPLQATVDHKADLTVRTNFTVKVVVKGVVSNTSKYLVRIHNRDVEEGAWSTCRSINDPHIITFDGKYYDNFLEGYFYLYRNKMLPYQVQVLYQNCNESMANVTCACAAAVVSNDDVFVIDKCRRLGCVGEACNAIRTVLYTTGTNLTAGTRIIERSQGLDYKIILPHGTIVKIQVTLRQLNVHIIPSTYDRDATEGLCGTFNANSTDDFTYPNGTILNDNGGSGVQPNEYSYAWRVEDADLAFDGVLRSQSPFIMSNYCSCHHVIIKGVQCHCGINKLVETCDIDTEGELNSTQLLVIQRRSLRELAAANPDMTVVSPMDMVDIDDEYRPPTELPPWTLPGRAIDETDANRICREALNNSVVGQACPIDDFLPIRPPRSSSQCIENAWLVCKEDIQITDTTLWLQSAVELMKQCCQEEFDRRLHICVSDLHSIENNTCLNDCSNNGYCTRGQCSCTGQWSGGDCSFSVTSQSQVTSTQTVVCDRRHENCQYIPFYGTSLHTANDLHCTARRLLVTSTGATVDTSQTSVRAPVHLVNPYQAACHLSSGGNYSVTVASTAGTLTTFNVLNTDLVCYRCDPNTGACWRKTNADHCVINGGCYEPLQADVRDNCSICNTTLNTNGWSDRQDDYCMELRANQTQAAEEERKSNIIRATVVSVLIIVIILLTIVIFCCQKNRAPVQQKTTSNGVAKTAVPTTSLSTGYINAGANLTDQSQSSSQTYHKPPTIVVSTIPPYSLPSEERERAPSVGSSSGVSVQEMLRIKQLAAESQRDRASSIGQTSVRSLGIGGGGPIQYSRFTPNVTSGDPTSMDNLGIGGGHTIKHRSLSDADNLLIYQL